MGESEGRSPSVKDAALPRLYSRRHSGIRARDSGDDPGPRTRCSGVGSRSGSSPTGTASGHWRRMPTTAGWSARSRSEEILLHGYFHQRQQGWGPTTWLAEGCDEMNGLDPEETRRTLERGQRVFTDVFGEPARGFVAPAWQPGHVRVCQANPPGLDYVLGFFSLETAAGRKVPLATWTWDCGRWGWFGHLGDGIGWLSQSLDRGVPTLAIHPRDLERGFWPKILRLTQAACSKEPDVRTDHAEDVARRVRGAKPSGMLKSLFDAVMERRAGQLMRAGECMAAGRRPRA